MASALVHLLLGQRVACRGQAAHTATDLTKVTCRGCLRSPLMADAEASATIKRRRRAPRKERSSWDD